MTKKLAALFLAFGFVLMSMAPAFARHGDRDSFRWNQGSNWSNNNWNNNNWNNSNWNRRQHFNRRTFNNNNGAWRSQRKWNNGKKLGHYKNGKAYRNYRNWW